MVGGAVLRRIGPFVEGGLDETLRLPILLGRIGLGEALPDAQTAAHSPKVPRAVTSAVVREHSVHVVDAVAPEEGQGLPQKPLGRLLALIGLYGRVAEPGGSITAARGHTPSQRPGRPAYGLRSPDGLGAQSARAS